jgi:Do/DeqQ family serine protease
MKKTISILISLFFLSSAAHASIPTQTIESEHKAISMSTVLEKTLPAIVNIVNQGQLKLIEDPFLRRELLQLKVYSLLENKPFVSFGSGVVIDAQKGLIVTNAHVVDLDKKITVTLNDGRHYEAKKLGFDNKTDIAVIQIPANHLTQLTYGDASQIKVGDFVCAIGSPLGLKQTVTSGIISALHRSQLGLEGFENFIQTDAAINMGSSGGALINTKGELIGINTALLAPSKHGGNIGIGFAIPIDMVKSIVSQITQHGNVERGVIGVMVQDLTLDLAEAFGASHQKGALVAQVFPGSPASNADIQPGDIITQVNGQTVSSNDDVHNWIGLLRINEIAKMQLLRHGKIETVSVKTIDPDKLSKEEKDRTKPFLYSVRMENITEQNPYHGYYSGVRVLDIDEYSAAWLAGLRRKDIIVSANHQRINHIHDLLEISEQNKNGLLLNILRDKAASFIVIKNNTTD